MMENGEYRKGMDYASHYAKAHPRDLDAQLLAQMFYAYGMHNRFDLSLTASYLLRLDSTSVVAANPDITDSGLPFVIDYVELCEVLNLWDRIAVECPQFLSRYSFSPGDRAEIQALLSQAYQLDGRLVEAYQWRKQSFDINLLIRQADAKRGIPNFNVRLEQDIHALQELGTQIQNSIGTNKYSNDANACYWSAWSVLNEFSDSIIAGNDFRSKTVYLHSDKDKNISYATASPTYWITFYQDRVAQDSIKIANAPGYMWTANVRDYFADLFSLAEAYCNASQYLQADGCLEVIRRKNIELFPLVGDRLFNAVAVSTAQMWIDIQTQRTTRSSVDNDVEPMLADLLGITDFNIVSFIRNGKHLLGGYWGLQHMDAFPNLMYDYYAILAEQCLYQNNYASAIRYANLSDSIADAFLQYETTTYLLRETKYSIHNQLIRAKSMEHIGTTEQIYLSYQRLYDKLVLLYIDMYVKPHCLSESMPNGFPKEIYAEENRAAFPSNFNTELHSVNHIAALRNIGTLNQLAYQQALFQKSLLLNTNNFLFGSDTVRTSSVYRQLMQLKQQQMYTPHNYKYDSITNRINQLEAEIVFRYMDSTAIIQTLCPSIESIRHSMQNGELAIEFIECVPSENVDSTYYAALLLNNKNPYPTIVTLCRKQDLLDCMKPATSDGAYIKRNELSQCIWSKLLPYTLNVKTIYFVPTGLLHNIPLETLPYDTQSIMSEHFSMVRLSSTREIVALQNRHKPTSAVIYGGIQYDVSNSDLMAAHKPYQSAIFTASRDLQLNRGSVRYLPWTKKEAETINTLLRKKHISVELYISNSANEESFKFLSGKHKNIIHISTHGIYWSEPIARKQDYFARQMHESESTQSTIEPLDRCALLFAGANTALSGYASTLPTGVQDGVLTAREIALLDLRDCDLLVLSACQTALGDITSEGVFGLQRAFKQAGVKTIIMTLWSVKDQPTQFFMTEFYRNLTTFKQDKHTAFRNAQNATRKKYPEPVYWAGFIMLD